MTLANATAESLLRVSGLRIELPTEAGIVHAVNGVSFDLHEREILGVVGESGCGKSMTALGIMGLLPPPGRVVAGKVEFGGRDLVTLGESSMRTIRGRRIGMIFQDPSSSLNPVLSVGEQIGEGLQFHLGMSKGAARIRARELLRLVGIPDAAKRMDDYPHQFSGGMRQRVMIAIAVSCEPSILICDEPTTSLDVTIQAQIIELLLKLREELATAIVLITHDMGVIARIVDRVIVMYAGEIMESSGVDDLFGQPRHPYTSALLDSVRQLDAVRGRILPTIEGQPPDLRRVMRGCAFWDRCPLRMDSRCETERPPLRVVGPAHLVATFCEPGPA